MRRALMIRMSRKIREAVLEKNVQWHHRYRTVDQFNIFGQALGGVRIRRRRGRRRTASRPTPWSWGRSSARRDVKTVNRDKAVSGRRAGQVS